MKFGRISGASNSSYTTVFAKAVDRLGSLLYRPQPDQRTVFQGFWHGPPLGPLREACLASFLRHGHRYHLYCYEKVQVPEGVELKDASSIIPFSELFYWTNQFTGKQDISPFSDLFRFKLLFELGGWWSDADAICLSSCIYPIDRAWAQEVPEKREDGLGTSQMAFTKGDPLVAEIYERCLRMVKTNSISYREATGPGLISEVVKEKGLPRNVWGTPETFYPVRWIEMFKLWLPQFKDEILDRTRNSLFLPVYASFPNYIGLQMGLLPPEGSYLADIILSHRDYGKAIDRYSALEIETATKNFIIREMNWAIEELWNVAGSSTLERIGFGRVLRKLPAANYTGHVAGLEPDATA